MALTEPELTAAEKADIQRFIQLRSAEDGCGMDPITIGNWIENHIHELRDKDYIAEYLAANP